VNTVFDILPETIRVLIGDDHRIVREGLKQILADAPDVQVVCEAQTGAQVMAEVQNLGGLLGLDLVLLDIAMPGMDGLDVLQALKREYPRLPVLMLSTYPEKQYAVRCIRLGACGYLNKSADPDDMLAAVRKAAGGGVFREPGHGGGALRGARSAAGRKPGVGSPAGRARDKITGRLSAPLETRALARHR